MAIEQVEKTPPPAIIAGAIRGELEEVEKALQESPEAVSVATDRGRTALSFACQHGHAKVVTALLAAGAQDSATAGWTAVHHAAFGGHLEVLSTLLAKGQWPKAEPAPMPGVASTTTMTPLLLAASRGHVACIEKLVEASPDSLSATDAHGRNALMHAASSGSVDAVKALVKAGVPIDAASTEGKTALMWAVLSHQPKTLEALIELGADVDVHAPLPKTAAIVPGQDRSKGESAEDFANGRNSKDPTLRHMSKYLRQVREAKAETPGAPPPKMEALPWVSHAEEFVAKKAAEAAAGPAIGSNADEPAIAELAGDDNDIFGDADVSEPAPTTEAAASSKAEPEGKKGVSFAEPTPVGAAEPAAEDLDALD